MTTTPDALAKHFTDVLSFGDTSLPKPLFTRTRTRVKEILESESKGEFLIGQTITVAGWVRTVRLQQKDTLAFVSVNDGSCFDSLQVIAAKDETENFEDVLNCGGIGSSLRVTGEIVESPNKKSQSVEMKAISVEVLGKVDPNAYPFKKTKHAHSMEFLRENAHLRCRTNLIGAVARVRNALSFATHNFYKQRGFLYVHTPIITASDCEGAGEMFQVTTILNDKGDLPRVDKKKEAELKKKEGHYKPKEGDVDYTQDFFSRPSYLTVSGQLNVEGYACGLSDVYTFGPTFRAENSHTSRHLSEFWMIEPEMCFVKLPDVMNLAEDYLKYCTKFVMENCASDLKFFEERMEKGLLARLQNILDNEFKRLTYTEAIEVLNQPENLKEGNFEEKPYWGIDLGSEHERYLTEKVYKKPVMIVNYPASFKAFYMKRNDEKVKIGDAEHETVQGMDILVPKIGEIIGGSVREERQDVLEEMIAKKGLDKEAFNWYLDLRRYGTVPHGGFGLGFERLVMFVTGVENIRDVIPYPRAPGQCEF